MCVTSTDISKGEDNSPLIKIQGNSPLLLCGFVLCMRPHTSYLHNAKQSMMLFRCVVDDDTGKPIPPAHPTHLYFNRRAGSFALGVACIDMSAYTGSCWSDGFVFLDGSVQMSVPAMDIIELPVPSPNRRMSRSVARELESEMHLQALP